MQIRWFGTASLGISTAEGRLLIDPFFPMRGSPTQVARGAYDAYPSILVTHGHFDHIQSLPEIIRRSGARVYCTRTPYQTLVGNSVPKTNLARFDAGDTMRVEGMRVTAYPSRHVRYDRAILRRTILNARVLRHARNLLPCIRGLLKYPENGETVAFLIEAEGVRLLVLGSLNLADSVAYPTGVDLLVLPYQGTSDLLTPALAVIDRLRPAAVLLDHFDDAFPPVSSPVDSSDIENALRGRQPVYRLDPGGAMQIPPRG